MGVNYRKYLKRNPDIILKRYPKEKYYGKQREIVRLRAEGMTFEKIGQRFGTSRQNIDSTLNTVITRYLEYFGLDEEIDIYEEE